MKREYRDFNRLDPRLFKAFLAAAHAENFTIAAQNAAMTQSGISQQIAKLEDQVGVQLFKRVNKAVILTEAGRQLERYIERYLVGMDTLFDTIANITGDLAGRVSYAMPNSCLLSPHLGMMLAKKKAYPGLELDIQIAANNEVYDRVLSGECDFGFVTQKIDNPGLDYIAFCKEEFSLVGGPAFKNRKLSEEGLKKVPFITFPGADVYFSAWIEAHAAELGHLPFHELQTVATISQLDGVITLLKGDIGITVMPQHCLQEQLDRQDVFLLTPCKSMHRVLNQIYVITLKGHELARRSRQVIDWFLAMHPEG